MSNSTQIALEPAALTAFAASMATLPAEEIRKAKSLFVRNAIADYEMTIKTSRGVLIVFGVMSVIPVFLFVFIPTFIAYRASKTNGRRKIQNALEVWKDDLGSDYVTLQEELQRI